MGITSTTGAKLVRGHVVREWFPGGLVDQFIRKLRFQKVGPLSETAESITMRRIGDLDPGDVDADQPVSSAQSNDPQVQAKKVAIIRQLGAEVIAGQAADFDSLERKVTPGQTLSIPTPTKEDLHRLVYKVTASDGFVGSGPDCLVANERVVRYIIKLMEDARAGPMYIRDSDLGTSVPVFNGIPVFVGQVPTTANLTSIWALKLSGPTGIRVLHAGGKSSEFGIEVRTSSKHGALVGGCYGLMIPEAESIATINHLTVTTIPP